MAEDMDTRVDRLESIVLILAEAQIKNEERFAEIAQRFRETDERFRKTDERFRQTDERIDKLVSAIGEMLRRKGGQQQ